MSIPYWYPSAAQIKLAQEKYGLINEAIDFAGLVTLRQLAKDMVLESDKAYEFACSEMLLTAKNLERGQNDDEEDDDDREDEEDKSEEEANENPLKRKRKECVATRHALCENCEKEHDKTRNGPNSCDFHPGIY
jgi:hypothetical protein